ncbi:MAG: porin [Bacteroidaceae bacterium]|nr:porin [Bacteroidaceae bacterium]
MRRIEWRKVLLTAMLSTVWSGGVMAQQETPDKATDWKRDLAERIQLHGYAQGGYNYTHRDGTDANTFEIKRVIFWAEARITDRWSFLFMHNFSGEVQEYYTDYRITRNKLLTARIGQFKNGLSIENPLSPTSLEAIDVCSEPVSYLTGCGSDPLQGVQYGRDLGFSLFGETNNGKFRYELDIMNGQGINKRDLNPEKDFIGRLEYRPLKGLNIVTTGQLGRGHAVALSPFNAAIALGQNYRRNRWTVGADYRSKAFNVRAEYMEGKDGNVVSRGGYITGAVPLGESKCDLVASYDYFNYNTDFDMDQHKVVAGLQYWFFGKCRLQAQYVYKSAYATSTAFVPEPVHAIMCQMQVRFH